MMRNFFFFAAVFFSCPAWAAVDNIEAPIKRWTTPVSVSVSTSSYTNVISTTTRALYGITAILIDNPSTNTGIVHGHIGNCTSTAVSTSTVKGPIEIAPSSNGGSIGLSDDECIWLVSRHTSAESVTIQAVSQR